MQSTSAPLMRPPPEFPPAKMYSLRDFGSMIGDAARFNAYAKAIARAVRPGDVVAEIGCGPAVFSLLACQAGARRVFAIELDDSIHFARQLAAANDFSDRIQFFQSDSRKSELPERANVIISDIRGAMPLHDHAIPSLEDARQRLLAPNGIMIPQRDTLKAAVIQAAEYYAEITSPWRTSVPGVDLSPSLSPILNQTYSASFKKEQLLTEPMDWGLLDYSVGTAASAAAELEFHVPREGMAHGVCVWFEAKLFEDFGYSTGPGAVDSVYGQLFLPWLQPVALVEGQKIHLALHADLVGQDYIWRWETQIPATAIHPAFHFQQSTFQGANFSPHALRCQAVDYAPLLSEAGQADLWMLQRMDGTASLQTIAQSAAEQFPRLFSSWREAFRRAADLSKDLSR
jgi:type I protein arginine methyltransferase